MGSTQENPAADVLWRKAETEARFMEWEGAMNDAAHRREITTQQLRDMGLSDGMIFAFKEFVGCALAAELAEKSKRQSGVY